MAFWPGPSLCNLFSHSFQPAATPFFGLRGAASAGPSLDRAAPCSPYPMGKKKTVVEFDLPEEAESEVDIVDDEYLETPYTSILMSTASGDGYAAIRTNMQRATQTTPH